MFSASVRDYRKRAAITCWRRNVSARLDVGGELVFPARATNHPRKLDPYWLAARRRAALPDVRLHDLRHSFASTAIIHGIPLATIGKLLGHALPESTARYAHLADEVIADAAERVSGGLARQLGLGR